jgi:hypothetical protein
MVYRRKRERERGGGDKEGGEKGREGKGEREGENKGEGGERKREKEARRKGMASTVANASLKVWCR